MSAAEILNQTETQAHCTPEIQQEERLGFGKETEECTTSKTRSREKRIWRKSAEYSDEKRESDQEIFALHKRKGW